MPGGVGMFIELKNIFDYDFFWIYCVNSGFPE